MAMSYGLSMHGVLMVFEHECNKVFSGEAGKRCVGCVNDSISNRKLNATYPKGERARVRCPLAVLPYLVKKEETKVEEFGDFVVPVVTIM